MPDADLQAWFREALSRFESPLTRYARGFTRDTERARDVVQDTFLRLLRQDRAQVQGHLKEWLFTVCRNRALDICRKEGPMRTTDDTGFASLIDDQPGPAAALERRETTGRILELLDELPEKQREVIRLKFANGLSYKEISRITSHSVSYVGVLIHTGMKSLRHSVGAMQPEAGGKRS